MGPRPISVIFRGLLMDEHKDDPAGEIRALIIQWKSATDPESLWMLRLLREALEKLERERKPSG